MSKRKPKRNRGPKLRPRIKKGFKMDSLDWAYHPRKGWRRVRDFSRQAMRRSKRFSKYLEV